MVGGDGMEDLSNDQIDTLHNEYLKKHNDEYFIVAIPQILKIQHEGF